MADFEDHVALFSILFSFLLSIPFSPLTAKAVPLPSNAHYEISKAVLSNMMLISRRRQSVLHRL